MEVTYSLVSQNGMHFFVAEIDGKLAGCSVPDETEPDLDKFLSNLRQIYGPINLKMGKVPSNLVEAVLKSYNGKSHGLSEHDIVFDKMKASYSKILRTLFDVEKGSTLSYSELALKSGLTKDHSRFVGTTMAKNPIPLIIPCHRVVTQSGKLGNYSGSGGVRTKKRLLDIEMK